MNLDSRKVLIIVSILLIGLVYSFRLFYMQVIDDTWALRAQEISERRKEITPPRAIVHDRNGKKIVANRAYFNLMMIEDDITDFDTVGFGKLIDMSVVDIKKRFAEIKKGEGTYYNPNTGKTTSNYQKIRAYPFLKELTLEEIAAIAPHLENFPGFFEEVTSMRYYPYANAANILGYLAEVSREDIQKDGYYRPSDNMGRAGLERFYEKELRGQKGVRYVVTSALNNAIEAFEGGKYDTIARQAPALQLGLDMDLQAFGEHLMQNKKGSIVAIEPESGEILSMVSAPGYDPNLLVGKRNISLNYPTLVRDENKPLFPRPLQAEYPPGSIFKLLQSLIGLQEGVIDINTGFPCTKSLVGCHNHPQATSIIKAVQYSCNPYYYYTVRKIIQQGKESNVYKDSEVGLNIWYEYMKSFGLGQKLNSDITGQRPGRIPNSSYYDKWYGHHQWAFSTIRSISIGQGEIALTPLQMANVAALIANHGWYYTPHFVRKIGDKESEFKVKNITKVEAKYFVPVVEGMRRVVNEDGGTARRARIDGITVCGKTGTVQNPHGKDHSVFIAFAPMENPKIAVAVFIENAGFGGTWAAPTASLMIEKYLKGEVKDSLKVSRIADAKLSNLK
ncbi:MAG: penicillin-binding protein 2 [Psychromonas sp.]|jgi:penicillin-binding protein 2